MNKYLSLVLSIIFLNSNVENILKYKELESGKSILNKSNNGS